jgi:hypothetical protein
MLAQLAHVTLRVGKQRVRLLLCQPICSLHKTHIITDIIINIKHVTLYLSLALHVQQYTVNYARHTHTHLSSLMLVMHARTIALRQRAQALAERSWRHHYRRLEQRLLALKSLLWSCNWWCWFRLHNDNAFINTPSHIHTYAWWRLLRLLRLLLRLSRLLPLLLCTITPL